MLFFAGLAPSPICCLQQTLSVAVTQGGKHSLTASSIAVNGEQRCLPRFPASSSRNCCIFLYRSSFRCRFPLHNGASSTAVSSSSIATTANDGVFLASSSFAVAATSRPAAAATAASSFLYRSSFHCRFSLYTSSTTPVPLTFVNSTCSVVYVILGYVPMPLIS